MKIIVLDGYTANPGDLNWEAIAKYGDLEVYDRTPPDQIISRIGDAEIVLTNKAPLSRAVFEACPGLKYAGVLATGYNVVDSQAAKEHGVVVTNIPAYSTATVAQYTFALLLELCHRVGHHDRTVKEGRWAANIDWCYWDYPLIELAGKTMGIIGFGNIGRRVASIATAFGMEVLVFNRSQDPAAEGEHLHYASLEELLKKSDVISLHCPLSESTEGIICKENISKMKDGVIILNDSRGSLIVDEDLADALKSGKVAGAAVDVLTEEPPRSGNPLIGLPNCIVTPHMAWASKEARIRLTQIAAANLEAYLSGAPVNVVNS